MAVTILSIAALALVSCVQAYTWNYAGTGGYGGVGGGYGGVGGGFGGVPNWQSFIPQPNQFIPNFGQFGPPNFQPAGVGPNTIAAFNPGPGQSGGGIFVSSSSGYTTDKDGKVHKTGGTTVLTENDGQLHTFSVGDAPPKIQTVQLKPVEPVTITESPPPTQSIPPPTQFIPSPPPPPIFDPFQFVRPFMPPVPDFRPNFPPTYSAPSVVNSVPTTGGFSGMAVTSFSGIGTDKDGNVVKTGDTTILTNDNGDVNVYKVGKPGKYRSPAENLV